MQCNQSETGSGRGSKIAALLVFSLSLAVSAFSQTSVVNAALATSPARAPKGVKILASVPLNGRPVTRMFTQSEHGRTYLYIEHGGQLLTTVDVSKKRHPQVVNHEPAKVEPKRYEELAEGGTIEVSLLWGVDTGVDNVGGRGMFSVLESSDPLDGQLLRAFGQESSNLADRDRHLIFFASPGQLVIVEDGRWQAPDYTTSN